MSGAAAAAADEDGITPLIALYDKGVLVPFIGSGMSVPLCASWTQLIERLEALAGIAPGHARGDLIARGHAVLERLRREGGPSVVEALEKATYLEHPRAGEPSCKRLAQVHWPLVCTTNYDDLYLRAVAEARKAPPRVLGRSELHCRQVLQHASLPYGEVLWALQGLLPPRGIDGLEGTDLSGELVLGHDEYRRVSHRAPHFRRCFAELFRTRSMLFLGSGLEEAYFRSLFDEVIELVGPPVRPHFAVVEAGKLDAEFMRAQYHIQCITYPKGEHGFVAGWLDRFAARLRRDRARPAAWHYRLDGPDRIKERSAGSQFQISRSGLPGLRELGKNAAIAFSAGRGPGARPRDLIGTPLPGESGERLLGESAFEKPVWRNDYVAAWPGQPQCYAVVARMLNDAAPTSRDRRSIDHVRLAFEAFLETAFRDKVHLVHAQLLAAGRQRTFEPWVSLVQMARAFGDWHRRKLDQGKKPDLQVVLHIVDPSIIALIGGGYLDLLEVLEGGGLRLVLEVIDKAGRLSTSHIIVNPGKTIGSLPILQDTANKPRIDARPRPSRRFQPHAYRDAAELSFRHFGLVAGSTLVLDYRG